MKNIVFLVMIVILIIKNMVDKQKEMKSLKQLSSDFDSYQKECKAHNDSINAKLQKVELDFRDYSDFVSQSMTDVVKSFDDISELSSNIVNANQSMLYKIKIIEQALKSNSLSIENEEMAELISILKDDIVKNHAYSEMLKEEMRKKYHHFSKMEETHIEHSSKALQPPPSKPIKEHHQDRGRVIDDDELHL